MTPQHEEQPIPTPRAQRVADFKRQGLPVVVWVVSAAICVWMLAGRLGQVEYIGLAQALQYEISAGSTGRLDTVVVDVYDSVQAGDVVAMLDRSVVGAAIETANASIRQLSAELEAARARMLSDTGMDRSGWITDLRRFQADEEQRRLSALELSGMIEADEIEAERLGIELQRAQAMHRAEILSEQELHLTALMHDQVRKRIDENRILVAQTEQEYRAARQRREDFERNLPTQPGLEPLLLPVSEAISVELRRLEELRIRRESLVLRSPVDGQVSQVFCRRGQTVVPGEPVLTVTDRSVTEIVAYLTESDTRPVGQNTPVLVASRKDPTLLAESVVLRMGPGPQMLPQRLWRDPGVPDYGRAVVIAAIPELRLTPGEMVDIRFLRDR